MTLHWPQSSIMLLLSATFPQKALTSSGRLYQRPCSTGGSQWGSSSGWLTSSLPRQLIVRTGSRSPFVAAGVPVSGIVGAGIVRDSHGGDKEFVNALRVGADARAWLLEEHKDARQHGLKAVTCRDCKAFAYLKATTSTSTYHCAATKRDVDVYAVLKRRDAIAAASGASPSSSSSPMSSVTSSSASSSTSSSSTLSAPSSSALTLPSNVRDSLLTRNILWPHDVDSFEAEVSDVSVEDPRSLDLLTKTALEGGPAKTTAQSMAPIGLDLSRLDALQDWQWVYWNPEQGPVDATLAAALDHLAVQRDIEADSTHVLGSTLETTASLWASYNGWRADNQPRQCTAHTDSSEPSVVSVARSRVSTILRSEVYRHPN